LKIDLFVHEVDRAEARLSLKYFPPELLRSVAAEDSATRGARMWRPEAGLKTRAPGV
jgi:hypothetical protein